MWTLVQIINHGTCLMVNSSQISPFEMRWKLFFLSMRPRPMSWRRDPPWKSMKNFNHMFVSKAPKRLRVQLATHTCILK